jgi:hypothetical protein
MDFLTPAGGSAWCELWPRGLATLELALRAMLHHAAIGGHGMSSTARCSSPAAGRRRYAAADSHLVAAWGLAGGGRWNLLEPGLSP